MKQFLAAGCALLLAACGTFPWPQKQADAYWLEVGAARPASRVESLLAYAGYVRGLSAAESAREHERLRQAFAGKDRSDFARLQYALLLAVSAGAGRDPGRARQLLDPLLKEDGHDAELRRLAAYLHAGLGDQLDAERRIGDEQRRAADLEQKLDAFKAIEHRIIQRTAPENKR